MKKAPAQYVDGTIVECNAVYGASSSQTAMHCQAAENHGFTEIADFIVMDEDGSMNKYPILFNQ